MHSIRDTKQALAEGRISSRTEDEGDVCLYRALTGQAGGFSFLFEQQRKLAEIVDELKRCDQTDRMAFRRCQADVMRAMKPMCILAWEAKGFEVRLMALESLTQCVMDDSEMAALLGASGLLERAVNHSLRPVDTVGHQGEYLAALQIELAVASVVPEAPAHKSLIPNVVKLLMNKVDNSVEVRHTAMEVLTNLSFATYQRHEVAALLPESLLEVLLESDASSDIQKMHVAAGRASICDIDPERLTLSKEDTGRLSDVNVLAKVTGHTATNFSAGAREFTKMVAKTSEGAHKKGMQEMDGYHFNAALLMANVCELEVPGAEPPKTFAQIAEPFWNKTGFFRGVGACLTATLKGEAWPVVCDVHHKPLRIVGTLLHLAFTGHMEKLTHAIPPLLKAVMVCLEEPMDINGEPRAEVRVARLAAVTLRELTRSEKREDEEESFLASTVRLQYYRNQVKIDQALDKLKDEEPAAGDLLDFFKMDEEYEETWSDTPSPSNSHKRPSLHKRMSTRASLRSCGSIMELPEEEDN
mmetsp:Transcript_124776/g.216382  ORF Transcript_124776/g.216382 Transcript_124776/m.216382 type:complete len:527 (-) Transcript_124776:122-1702(-)